MVIPGYDPDDVDDALEAMLDESDLEELLSGDEWRAYRDGDAELIDLLEESEIAGLLDDREARDAA